MLKRFSIIIIFCLSLTSPLFAQDDKGSKDSTEESTQPNFEAFTGSISKNKVRMRLQPNLDAPIIREFDKDQLIVVVGQSEDFYIVQPTPDIKAYIYRTYVLDNTVEGHHVNVRLEPHLQSPVIAQLNTGDKIDGTISHLNSKWLEIAPPEETKFYVATEYVNKIGDEHYMATMQQRRKEVNQLLSSTYRISQSEMQKPFPQIDLTGIYDNYNKIINNYPDFTEQSGRAKKLLTQLQANYLEKKVAYLEALAKNSQSGYESKPFSEREYALNNNTQNAMYASNMDEFTEWCWENTPHGLSGKMSVWIPVEKNHFEDWQVNNPEGRIDDFYTMQLSDSIEIRGIVEPYERQIRNKPGDYLLLHRHSRIPIAYIYSTQIDLNNYVGHEVTVQASLRPNNNFAYPAYFALHVD